MNVIFMWNNILEESKPSSQSAVVTIMLFQHQGHCPNSLKVFFDIFSKCRFCFYFCF